MKKSELKSTLKPLIKECIKEVLFEEGILSGIISEVVKGTRSSNPSSQPVVRTEQKQSLSDPGEQKRILEQKWEQERERKRKLLDATGFKGVDLFEGTGIDISGIMAVGNGKKWKDLI